MRGVFPLNLIAMTLSARFPFLRFTNLTGVNNMADIQKITETVKAIIVKHLAVNADQVTPEARFIEDLNADSLDTVELVMEFEETFDLRISDDVVENMLTVGAAIDYIAKKLDEKAAAENKEA